MLDWWQVIELSKETNTGADGITLVAGSDKVAAAGKVVREDSLSDAFGYTHQQLNNIDSLYFPEQDEELVCDANTYCNGGSELSYTITGWARNAEAGLTFYTSRGDTVNILGGDITVKTAANEVLLSIAAADVASGRRRLFGFGGMMTSGSFMMMSSGF